MFWNSCYYPAFKSTEFRPVRLSGRIDLLSGRLISDYRSQVVGLYIGVAPLESASAGAYSFY